MNIDGVPIAAVVLNGEVTVQAVAQAASGRFRELAERRERRFFDADRDRSAVARLGDPSLFPRRPAPDDQPRPLGRRAAIDLAMPTSSVPAVPEAGIPEESMPRGRGPR